MIEKYSCYEFEIFRTIVGQLHDGWVYKIFGSGCHPYSDGVIESDEYYDSEQEARFAAIGHITQLENGPDDKDYL